MESFKTIVLTFLLLFHITLVIVIVNLDQSFTWLLNNPEVMKFATITGLILAFLYAFLNYLEKNSYERKLRRLEREKNEIKAKFYDQKEEEERIDKSIKSFGNSLEQPKDIETDKNKPNSDINTYE